MADARFLFFHRALLGWSVFAHIAPLRFRKAGFVTIWLRACEEFAENRFQLLFIYIDYIQTWSHTKTYLKNVADISTRQVPLLPPYTIYHLCFQLNMICALCTHVPYWRGGQRDIHKQVALRQALQACFSFPLMNHHWHPETFFCVGA